MAERQTGGASVVRADAIMQIARGLSLDRSDPDRPYRDLRVSVGTVSDGAYHPSLSLATGTPDLALAVARGEIDLAAANPSAFVTMAYRGTGPFAQPLPIRVLAVMPSWDRMAFAVAAATGLRRLSDIRERRYPLRLSIRGNTAHATRFLIDEALGALDFSLPDLEAWGGSLHYVDTPSHPERLHGVERGAIDAVFDEGIKGWGSFALQHGMRFLDLDEPVLARLAALGWPVGPIPQDRIAGLDADVGAAPSFSGWPLYTHADLPDRVAYLMVQALDAARHQIAWDTDGAVTLTDLRGGTDAAPNDVPLHPGAEHYYREHGTR